MAPVNVRKIRTNFAYTEESLTKALEDIRTRGKGIRETCRLYGVPRATVQDRLHGRVVDKRRKIGPDPILGFEGEQQIADWIIKLAKCGFRISKRDLLDTVAVIAKDCGKGDCFPNGKPGQKWYQSFLKRHPAISRGLEGISKARATVTEASLRRWFETLQDYLDSQGLLEIMNDPNRILKSDETGFSVCPKTGRVLAPKGYKNLAINGSEKDNITVLVMFTASGNIFPPLVVFPYKRPPKAICESMPSGWVLGKSESGMMRGDVFSEYIVNDFNKWLIDNNVPKPIILFVDGHKTHMCMSLSKFCEENGIILYSLPPNATHIMQPADVSLLKPLKQEWKNTIKNWQNRPENLNKVVTKTNFCSVFKETMNLEMTNTIKNGFRKCGLYPLNVEAIDFTKCVKNTPKNVSKTSDGNATAKDFEIAKKVFSLTKENIRKHGIDPEIILQELESAKSKYTKTRRSNSKTPRNSKTAKKF